MTMSLTGSLNSNQLRNQLINLSVSLLTNNFHLVSQLNVEERQSKCENVIFVSTQGNIVLWHNDFPLKKVTTLSKEWLTYMYVFCGQNLTAV